MRRIGKTTKAVDRAIQILFTEGKVIIPPVSLKYEDSGAWERFFIGRDDSYMEKVVLDPDHELGKGVQKELFRRVLHRLEDEHPHTELIINKNEQIIKI